MSRRRRAGMLSRAFAFLLASFANLSVGGRHTALEPLPNEAPRPAMSKHWPVMVTVRAAVAVVAIAAAVVAVTALAPVADAQAGMFW